MKIQNLTSGLMATLVLASPIAGAEDYPAANFQPKVIYSDITEETESSASTKKVETSVPDANYPAANFQPKVIYSDITEETESSTNTKKAETSVPDANYPAANFQPTVVYNDTDYKHQEMGVSTKPAVSTISEALNENEPEVDVEEESVVTLLGLFALAFAGLFLLKGKLSWGGATTPTKKQGSKTKTKIDADTVNSASDRNVTGVARYLSKNMPELSTVAQYLQNKNRIPTSGVAKYMAKKIVAAKVVAISKRTGVEKYLRNKG